MYTKDLYDLEITPKMVWIDCIDLRSLEILRTLNDLNILVVLNILTDVMSPVETLEIIGDIISKSEKNAMDPSSRLILSLQYLLMPIAATLNTISLIKIHVK